MLVGRWASLMWCTSVLSFGDFAVLTAYFRAAFGTGAPRKWSTRSRYIGYRPASLQTPTSITASLQLSDLGLKRSSFTCELMKDFPCTTKLFLKPANQLLIALFIFLARLGKFDH